MKILKIIFAITILSLFSISCSSSDDSSQKKYYLENVSGSQSGIFQKFIYNDKNLVVQLQNFEDGTIQSSSTITYNSKKNPETITGTDRVIRFFYNEDGTLYKRSTYNLNAGIETLYSTFEYSYSYGDVIERYYNVSGTSQNKSIYKYNDDKNLIEIAHYDVSNSNPEGSYNYSEHFSVFDDKKNPLSTIPKEFFFPNNSTNNYTSKYFSNSSVNQLLTYEYNADGYPISQSSNTTSEALLFSYIIK